MYHLASILVLVVGSCLWASEDFVNDLWNNNKTPMSLLQRKYAHMGNNDLIADRHLHGPSNWKI